MLNNLQIRQDEVDSEHDMYFCDYCMTNKINGKLEHKDYCKYSKHETNNGE